MYYIYKITNRINEKVYIGKTSNVHQRWMRHVSISARPGKSVHKKYLHHAIAKYGSENFSIETIASFENENDAFAAETNWIITLHANDRKRGMNLTTGGEGPSGFKHSEETKQHLHEVCSGWKHTPETLKKISNTHKGKHVSAATRQKLHDAFIGRKHSIESREKMSATRKITSLGSGNGFYGKQHSDKTKRKLQEKMTGPNSPRSKFTVEQVRAIRADYLTNQYTLQQLAEKHQSKLSTIYGIVSGKRYANVI